MFNCIDKEHLVAATGLGIDLGTQRSCVIATALRLTGAAGGRSSLATLDEEPQRLHPADKVSANGRTNNGKQHGTCRGKTEEILVGDHERPQVEGLLSTLTGLRDPTGVDLNQAHTSSNEVFDSQRWQGETLGRPNKTLTVLIRAEEPDRTVSVAVSLQALENLLGIMQHSAARIDIKSLVVDHGVVSPAFTGLPGSNSHVVGKDRTKSWIGMFQRDPLVGGPRQIVSRSKAQTHSHTLHPRRAIRSIF